MSQIILAKKDELISELLIGVEEIILKNHHTKQREKEYLTRKEVSDLLKVSLVTVHTWTEKGILKKYAIGGRIRYKADEVHQALIEIENKRS